jgi:antibiotic biosynthesis monooxygenase (ABM) superfamily enzyme
LFALYPTVMALNYVSPLMGNLSLPINMLISNMLSVAMLTWLLMPRVSRFLGFWLNSNSRNWRREARGLFIVVAGIALFVVLFSVL